MASEERVRVISVSDFVESEAGALFQAGDYERALGAIENLLRKYPGDSLLIRYQAMALDRIGRSEEAIPLFEQLLKNEPEHVPTHYFLGVAYARNGQPDQAMQQWKWVQEKSGESPYRTWAAEAIERSLTVSGGQEDKEKRRLFITGRYGYEYDTNVILKPDDKSLATPSDQNAGRQVLDLSLRYRPYSTRDSALDLLYTVRQTLHDDSLDEFNFHSEEFGLNLRKRYQVGGRSVIAGIRYDLLVGFLDENLFSTRNRWYLFADTRFTKQTRTIFFDRMTASNFGPDGFDRSLLSRDGFYHDAGVTHYFYSADFQKHLFVRGEFGSAHTEGKNFDQAGFSVRTGVHSPVIGKLALDASTGLEFGFFHNFESISARDASRRRNIDWDIYTALTYPLTHQLDVRGFYRLIDGNNQNNFFDFKRQIGGVEFVYRYGG